MRVKLAVIPFLALALASGAGFAQQQEPRKVVMAPPSVEAERTAISQGVDHAIQSGGQTGEVAQKINAILVPHYLKEESYVLPSLAVMPQVAMGKTPSNVDQIRLTNAMMRANIGQLFSDHKALQPLLADLKTAAESEKKPEAIRLSEQLRQELKTEEEIFYPAALTVGQVLKLKEAASEP